MIKTGREVLESTYRVGKMRKMRLIAYFAELALTIVLIIFLLWLYGASFWPIYFPYSAFFYVGAIMLLVANIQAFFFTRFGIKFGKSDSERFLMAKDSARKAIVLVVLSILVLVVIATPQVTSTAEEGARFSGSLMVSRDHPAVSDEFTPTDSLGLIAITRFHISIPTNTTCDVYVVPYDVYNKYVNQQPRLEAEKFNRESQDLTGEQVFRVNYIRDRYVIVFFNNGNAPVEVEYWTENELDPPFGQWTMIFCVIFAGANAMWAVYLRPIMAKYKKFSIYE